MSDVNPFDDAARYDAWYDTPQGRRTFEDEVSCVAPLLGEATPRLEVGVGTGRFAEALAVECGIDTARGALALAAGRGVRVVAGDAQNLPFAAGRFGVVLFVLTLCFVADPVRALREAHRVLVDGGRVVIGTIPRDSELGERYQSLARAGHDFYARARFLSVAEHLSLLEAGGFEVAAARSTFLAPDSDAPNSSREGLVPGAGFVALAGVARQRGNTHHGE